MVHMHPAQARISQPSISGKKSVWTFIGRKANEHYNHDLQAPGILGSQPEGKTDDRQKPDSAAAWVHSLKEKRMIVKSLTAQLQNRFHVSAAEIDEQDTHQIIVIGIAAIVPHNAMADSLMEEISLFVEENCEAEILEETREIR